MQACEKVSGGFFIARGDTPELLDEIEETLDQIALAVESEIAIALDSPICFRRDDRFDGAQFQTGNEAVGVIAFVSQKDFGPYLGSQRFSLGDVVDLAARQTEGERVSHGIDDHVDFRGQATARAAYGLVEAPFLRAPALC